MPGSKHTRQTVLDVRQWVPGKLFSLTVTREPAFQFAPGPYARLGLPESAAGSEPGLWRAYSMVNGPASDALGFYSIVAPQGLFQSKARAIAP